MSFKENKPLWILLLAVALLIGAMLTCTAWFAQTKVAP